MRHITFVIILFLFSFSAFSAETVEQRLVKLENKIVKSNEKVAELERATRTQSVIIANYKAKVAEVELQRSFLSDIYNGNSAWLIGIVSLVVVIAVGFSVFSNRQDLKDMKSKIESDFIEMEKTNRFNRNRINKISNNAIYEFEQFKNKTHADFEIFKNESKKEKLKIENELYHMNYITYAYLSSIIRNLVKDYSYLHYLTDVYVIKSLLYHVETSIELGGNSEDIEENKKELGILIVKFNEIYDRALLSSEDVSELRKLFNDLLINIDYSLYKTELNELFYKM